MSLANGIVNRISRDLSPEELSLIKRLLVLRRAKLIGPILAEYGNYWICDDEFLLQQTKRYYTLERLYELADNLEALQRENLSKGNLTKSNKPSNKPVQREEATTKDKRVVNG